MSTKSLTAILSQSEVLSFRRDEFFRAEIPASMCGGWEQYQRRNTQEQTLWARARGYVESFDSAKSRGLMLAGQTGVGKTLLAASMATALIERYLGETMTPFLRWFNTPAFFMRIRNSWQRDFEGESEREIIEEAITPQVAIFDDLGVEKVAANVIEQMYLIFDARWAEHKQIIITSNLGIADLRGRIGTTMPEMGARLASRIRGMVDSLGEFPRIDNRKSREPKDD